MNLVALLLQQNTGVSQVVGQVRISSALPLVDFLQQIVEAVFCRFGIFHLWADVAEYIYERAKARLDRSEKIIALVCSRLLSAAVSARVLYAVSPIAM